MFVHIYKNLNKKCWSVRKNGKVIAHLDSLFLETCTCHVQMAGYRKVNKVKRKNVHAYIKGEIIEINENVILENEITYDPYIKPFFRNKDSNEEVTSVELLYFNKNGKVFKVKK